MKAELRGLQEMQKGWVNYPTVTIDAAYAGSLPFFSEVGRRSKLSRHGG